MRFLAFLVGAACGEATRPGADAGPRDTSAAFDATMDGGDSGASDTAIEDTGTDAGQRDALSVDGSLAGTSLEGLPIEWTSELHLCERWLEDGTIEEAAARKIDVRLPPSPRPSLDPADLASAEIAGHVHRSPFAADQHRLEGASSTLVAWRVDGTADAARLSAEIAHDVAAGTLYESIFVARNRGDRSPLVYTGDGFGEVTFAFEPRGGARAGLEICDGGPSLETAVVVLTAMRGSDWVTLIREQRTSLAVAGSAPVYPTRAEVVLSGSPAYSSGVLTEGRWSQVYTAAHHNWDEHALVRFDRDLALDHLVFGPLRRGEMPAYPPSMVETIALRGVNTPAAMPELDLTSIALPSGAETTVTYDVTVDWTRVDETQLVREQLGCPSATVRTVWGVSANGTYAFQLGFCVGGPIIELSLFVPVYLAQDPTLAGRRFDSGAITPASVDGFAGVEIDLGALRVQLAEPGVFRMKVLDAANAELENTNLYDAELFETGPFAGMTEVIRGSSGGVSALVERKWVQQGAGNSAIFAPVAFELRFAGEVHSVTAWDALTYTNSHHNWDDTLVAEDEALRMFWMVREFGQLYSVRAERISDGAEVLPSTDIR